MFGINNIHTVIVCFYVYVRFFLAAEAILSYKTCFLFDTAYLLDIVFILKLEDENGGDLFSFSPATYGGNAAL